jgi:orotidine-5'-phosphate decarboxylase
MNFADRLAARVDEVSNPAVLGLDPHLDLLPPECARAKDPEVSRAERARVLADFCTGLIDLAAGRVAVVKPQSAFFEVLGADGAQAWESVVAAARAHGLLVIGDLKRGDVASTAAAYAGAYLEGSSAAERAHRCDAITVSPYLGEDSLEPFLAACKRADGGIFVLVRTSNPGSDAFQLHGSPALAERVAERVRAAGEAFLGRCGFSSVGAVVGATKGAELRRWRELLPEQILLLPGYGAQGARAEDVAAAFSDRGHRARGALVSSSRGIAFAWQKPEHAGKHWKDAAAIELERMITELRAALGIRV